MTNLPQAHILVVDDDERLRSLLQRFLKEQDYIVSTAADTIEAKRVLSLLKPDAMVLDVMMPGQTGLEFAQELNAEKSSQTVPPILMLTAMDAGADRVAGLESGVEDYLTKPFEPRELLLRIANILKNRVIKEEHNSAIIFADFSFDMTSEILTHKHQGKVDLTTVERALLKELAANLNQTVLREKLAHSLDADESSRQIDVQIARLRKKLGQAQLIQTVRGKGYKLGVSL